MAPLMVLVNINFIDIRRSYTITIIMIDSSLGGYCVPHMLSVLHVFIECLLYYYRCFGTPVILCNVIVIP